MKKFIAMLIAMILVLSTACFAEGYTFKMGFDAEYPPYTYMGDDGEYTGFDIEMCKGVCEKLGWGLELVPINWDTKLITLDAGEIDCIWSGLTIDVLDPEAYTISMAYSNNSQVILTTKSSGVTTLTGRARRSAARSMAPERELQLTKMPAAPRSTISRQPAMAICSSSSRCRICISFWAAASALQAKPSAAKPCRAT